MPIKRKIPRRVDAASSHQFSLPRDLYGHMYFEAIDVVCQQIDTRFDQKDIEIVADMERLLFELANGQHCPISDIIKSMYSHDRHRSPYSPAEDAA